MYAQVGFLVLMLGTAKADGKCEVQFIKSKFECFVKNPEWPLPEKSLYALSPMTVEVAHKTAIGVRHPDPSKADFSLDTEKYQFAKDEYILDCEKSVEEFPNTCEGSMTMLSWHDNGHWNRVYFRMALIFYSTYTPEDGKVHEKVQAQFLYGRNYKTHCTAELKFNSGECFGMTSTREPRPPQDPSPLGEGWTEIHVVQPPPTAPPPPTTSSTTESPTSTPEPTPEPAPGPTLAQRWGGPVILTLLFLALLIGCAVFFLRRQRLLQEEQALRTAREVELN